VIAVRLTIGLFAAIMALAFYSIRPETPEQVIAHSLSGQVASFDSLVTGPFITAVQSDAGQGELQQLFLETRRAYKRWEWAAEYWNPALARLVNGEPVPEADPIVQADPTPEGGTPGRFHVIKPQGLQVIETILFPRYDSTRKPELLDELNQLDAVSRQYKLRFDNIGLLPGQVFDAAKLEVFRVLTLGIAGFDAPLTQHSMEESAGALEGVRSAMMLYTGETGPDSLAKLFDGAIGYLAEHSGFDSFDRAAFISRYGNPLSRGITRLEARLQIPVIRYNRLLRQDAPTLFDRDAFDPDAYLPEGGKSTTGALVVLGRQLFSDPSLSGTGTRSCASCHRPDQAFADGMTRNTVLDGHDLLPRNTPTLLNAALQPAQFYDLRAVSLEDQAEDVLHNPLEMRGSLQNAVGRFSRDSAYRELWKKAFPGGSVDTTGVIIALAAYIRSLVRLDSRFDDYMRGDTTTLNTEELRGFNLFMGKARCGTCHYMPLFNGNFPPVYSRTEAEVIGVPSAPSSGIVDTDPGQFAVIAAPFLVHAFKTPGVRNVARTAPYMHNGTFSTLDQVVDFYDAGGGVGAGEKLDNQTLPADSLHLSTMEKKSLIAFLKSLDSR
jgi:cytochrome c peroxidase